MISFVYLCRYTKRLKAYIESYRTDDAISGYEHWLGFDWFGASNGIVGEYT